jgi:hypothetical protein
MKKNQNIFAGKVVIFPSLCYNVLERVHMMETVAVWSGFCARQEQFVPFDWRWPRTCSAAWRQSRAKKAAADVVRTRSRACLHEMGLGDFWRRF